MTLEEAKRYYFAYHGSGFLMGREEPGKYDQFRRLAISKEVIFQWDEELLNEQFLKLWENTDYTWCIHGIINDILQRKNCDLQANCSRLLDEMEQMDELNEQNRILIIENMAGRNIDFKDGLCRLICCNTNLAEKMNDIVRKIAVIPAENTPERLESAIQSYKSAYERYKGKR